MEGPIGQAPIIKHHIGTLHGGRGVSSDEKKPFRVRPLGAVDIHDGAADWVHEFAGRH